MNTSVLFGLAPPSIFLAKELSKSGSHVIGIGRYEDIGLYSKYIQGYVAETTDEIVHILDHIQKRSHEHPKAYICSDYYLTLLLEEYPEVFEKVDFLGADTSNLEMINNKNMVRRYCESIGIPMPKTYSYTEIVNDENVSFPLICKQNNSITLNSEKNPIGKIRVVRHHHELDKLKEEINLSAIPVSTIFVQDFISGNNANQYSFGGYFKDGKEMVGIVVNQLRQYPQGVSCFVKEINDKRIEDRIRDRVLSFVTPIKYTGFLELEFKIHHEHIYLMDINPRTWGWISILGKKYKSFHHLFSNKGTIDLGKTDELVMWNSPIRDVIGWIRNPMNPMNVKGVKHMPNFFKCQMAYDVHDRSDVTLPFSLIKVGVKRFLKKGKSPE